MYQLSIATSSLNLGAILGNTYFILGALLYKKLEDCIGTLRAFIVVDVLCLIFLAIQLIDLSLYYLVAGRFMYGVFMTMSLAMTPNFLNKLSKIYNPSIKGTLGSFNQLLIVCGMIVSYMMAYILPKTFEKDDLWDGIKWRLYIGMPIVFILIRLKSVLTRKEYEVVEENLLIESENTILTSQNDQIFKLKEKISYRKRLIVGILVIASNQLSCINGILFYARQMMDMVTDKD
jgi:MFS family permease